MISLSTFDTEYCADSVEFCPHPGALDILACGTYQLCQPEKGVVNPGPQKRIGRCYILSTHDDGTLTELQRIEMPAILDMRWNHKHENEGPRLAIAVSTGYVAIYRWLIDQRNLVHVQTIVVSEPEVLCLSLDWAGRRTADTASDNIVVSTSNGSLAVLSPGSDGTYAVASTWDAHDFEPWIAAWDYWSTDIIYSGGDDCKLKGWDLRTAAMGPMIVNKRFDAGVTSIQSNPHESCLLAVGSYDSTVRIFDTRKLSAPMLSVDVGGGAWRVKWHPSPERKQDLLVACMHDGFKAIRVECPLAGDRGIEDGRHQLLSSFTEHTSLAYGVDWSFRSPSQSNKTSVASCSFYDHVLKLWVS